MVTQVRNDSDLPVQIGEFATANVRFINPGTGPSVPDEADTTVARQGLTIDSADQIQPGETRVVRVTATDTMWAGERLQGFIRDADSRLGGLLFLFDAAGNRHVASISSAVIPKFD
jgi:methane/ammonia monooxygenase subunit B